MMRTETYELFFFRLQHGALSFFVLSYSNTADTSQMMETPSIPFKVMEIFSDTSPALGLCSTVQMSVRLARVFVGFALVARASYSRAEAWRRKVIFFFSGGVSFLRALRMIINSRAALDTSVSWVVKE